MKKKYIFPMVALGLALASCDDQIMEWRDGDPNVSTSEIPLEVREKLALYKPIKEYVKEFHPEIDVTSGMSLDQFLSNEAYREKILENFTGVTFGNAMKHQSLVSASGATNWDKIDQFIAMNTGLKLHGHNLIWHTQQQQTYLKSLIAPEMVISGGASGGIVNIITNSDFEGGNDNGWSGWSHYSKSVVSPGHDSDHALLCEMDGETNVNYDCQLWWSTSLEIGKTYAYRVWVKSPDNIDVQFVGQNASYGGIYKNTVTASKDWTVLEGEFEYTGDPADICRIGIQFGGTPNSKLYVDDFEFGEKQEGPANLCPNGDFSEGTEGWKINNPGAGVSVVEVSDAPSGNKNVLKMTASDSSTNAWDLQVVTGDMPVQAGQQVEVSFFVKSEGAGQGRNSYSGLTNSWPWTNWTGSQSSWTEAFETSTSWMQIKYIIQKFSNDFEEGAQTWNINFDFGYVPNMTYYIDNVVVNVVEPESASAPGKVIHKATSISYIPKTAEEKRAILLEYMESWIKECMEHVGPYCSSWDVVNEPIHDNCKWRGFDGAFMSSSDGEDTEPTETTEEGLNLNWENGAGNGHWYWGYFIGKDYAAKAFEYAAKYNPNGAKLFVNDYNLETNPSKLAELIKFVEFIDANGGHVDGIGTQMHVSSSITKDKVDAMFKTMAATGKLVRVTELDVAVGTTTPSAEQLQEQSDVYQMIIESYFENVPEAQRSAITIWGLSDKADEHEYWLNGDAPNIFDGSYERKTAYKGVCDAIAGQDLSEGFNGDQWKELVTVETETEE